MNDSAASDLMTSRSSAARVGMPLHTPVPIAADAARAAGPHESRVVLPVVGVLSLAGHGLLLAVIAILPAASRIEPIPAELAFVVLEPDPRPLPEPIVTPPEPVPVEDHVAAVVEVPRPRPHRSEPRRESEPAPPAPVLTSGREAGAGEWAHPPGEEGGDLLGQHGARGTGPASAAAVHAPEPVAEPGISRAQLRGMLAGYIRDTLSRFLDGRIDYPLSARRAEQEGVVMLRVRVARDGRILGVRLSRTSGHDALDRAALASVQGLGTMPAPPREIPWDEARELPLPVTYVLR